MAMMGSCGVGEGVVAQKVSDGGWPDRGYFVVFAA